MNKIQFNWKWFSTLPIGKNQNKKVSMVYISSIWIHEPALVTIELEKIIMKNIEDFIGTMQV